MELGYYELIKHEDIVFYPQKLYCSRFKTSLVIRDR